MNGPSICIELTTTSVAPPQYYSRGMVMDSSIPYTQIKELYWARRIGLAKLMARIKSRIVRIRWPFAAALSIK